jgi:hypothetical protein
MAGPFFEMSGIHVPRACWIEATLAAPALARVSPRNRNVCPGGFSAILANPNGRHAIISFTHD